MACSGSDVASSLEADLALSDDDRLPMEEHWPELPEHDPRQSLLTPQHVVRTATSSTSNKRPVEDSTDSPNVDYPPPVTKTARCDETSSGVPVDQPFLPRPAAFSAPAPSRPSSDLPAFAPRDAYVKLSFSGNPSTDTKLRWLSEVTKTFQLQRELAEVKMAAVTSRFVYISRRRADIIDRVKTGEFLSLPLILQDSTERPRKFPSYILTRFPVNVDPSLAKSFPGVYSARRFIQDGAPINRIVVVWSLPDPPPPVISFAFLPCLPPCEVRKLHNDQPWCYRCWGIGHISRYCSSSPKCAWCAADHDSRTCPARSETSRPATSSTTSEPPPPEDTSQWKCPRCLQPGVNVWHGCARRQAPAAAPPPPPPPPSHQSVSRTSSASPPDLDLRKSVTSLMARCTALENRFTALETRIDTLVASHAASDSKLSTMVEAQQGVITAISFLTDKMDSVASRLEKLCVSFSLSGPSTSTDCLSTSRSSTSKHKIRS